MPIPKIIYQTWFTKKLTPRQIYIQEQIKIKNKNYEILLYDDSDIDNFIKDNYSGEIYNTFKLIKLGAVKADFWRYLILYKYGGIYLDFDANINCNLDKLIDINDKAIISREGNSGVFLQWVLIFEKEHPILLDCILQCITNIKKIYIKKEVNESFEFNDIINCCGPRGFTESINNVMTKFYNKKVENLWFENDTDLNVCLNTNTSINCKFIGIDFNGLFSFKHEFTDDMYSQKCHWSAEIQNMFH